MTRILITGGMGFVGHHFVEAFLKKTDYEIVILDRLSYSSNGFDRVRDIKAYDDKRVKILSTDLVLPISEGVAQEIGDVHYIFHLAAESHVDKSIENPEPFVRSNVLGTMHLLNFARTLKNLKTFFYFSTDEVFGPAPVGYSYKEDDMHNPSNPYAAAKSGGEMLCKAYRNTYKLPIVITRSMNIMGERQHPEKFIPLCINKIRSGETIRIHANKDKTKAGSRFYIHARNVADGYLFLINKGITEGDYHITGELEVDNEELALAIGCLLGMDAKYELTDFHSARPGHDLRYALDGGKMAELGWTPPKSFHESLKQTVEWSISNPKWLK